MPRRAAAFLLHIILLLGSALTSVSFSLFMVEGHQVQRLAHRHRRLLVGLKFKADSPNGRFADGAAAINGSRLERVEGVGKNLFYFFSGETVMHVHFGMSGRFASFAFPGPSPTPTTRLRLWSEKAGIVAHLSAMTVQHGTQEMYLSKRKKLGEDPLREDADPEIIWQKLQKSKKPVGLMLMDQSVIAGVGNIYRAEILFKSRIHPEYHSNQLTRNQFDVIWAHCVILLQRGFLSGSILTVDEQLPVPWNRRYIYNHQQCPRCLGPVSTWDMAGRKVYACTNCQPLAEESQKMLSPVRTKALNSAAVTQPFFSNCASEDASYSHHLTVVQLKAKLASMGLSTSGLKAVLIARLSEAEAKRGLSSSPALRVGVENPPLSLVRDGISLPSFCSGTIKPGTLHLRDFESRGEDDVDYHPEEERYVQIATSLQAALEKELAGESKAVEHVALVEDHEHGQKKSKK